MQLSDMLGSLQGQLKLAVESSAKYFVPHLFAAFKRQHPEVNLQLTVVNRARMEGFVVMDYADRYAVAGQEMAGWLLKGQLKSKEHIVEGLESFPESLAKLFSGENHGKLVLKV